MRTQLPATLAELAHDRVGASIPVRDSIDHRAIRDIYQGTGKHPYVDMERNTAPPLPELPETEQVYASPDDPFPVWWKLTQGLPAAAEVDPHADRDGDATTHLAALHHSGQWQTCWKQAA